jgi:rubrerythrin
MSNIVLEKSLKYRFPEVSDEWDYSRNPIGYTPLDVRPYSSKKAMWITNTYARTIKSKVVNIPKVDNKPKKLSGKSKSRKKREKLKEIINLEIEFPEVARQWDYSKNLKNPEDYLDRSGKKVWWKCDLGHSWEATIVNRTVKKSGCPICRALDKKFHHHHPDLKEEYDMDKNKEKWEKVTRKSTDGYWWICPDCGLSYKMNAKFRDNGRSCPECNPKKPKLEKTLAYKEPEVAAEWHPTLNGNLTPEHVTAYCQKKVWWKCKEDPFHVWEASIHNRTSGKRTGCPECRELKRAVKAS